ncbi:MAG: P1 family peptidase, partial [Anaerolineae bacterium]
MGYTACQNATSDPVAQGTVGAGTGCRIGAMYGGDRATKGGLGSACIELGGGLKVAALAVVNAVGDVLDEKGSILAGLRSPEGSGFSGVLSEFQRMTGAPVSPKTDQGRENTVIGVVATNARLDKSAVNKVAQMAHDGLARAINPAHTMFDGDTIFALASGDIQADVSVIGAFGAQAFEAAIRAAVRNATSLYEVRAWNQ